VLEEKPGVVLLETYTYGDDRKTPNEVKVLAKQYGVPIIPHSSNELHHYESRGLAKVKCLIVCGNQMGEYKTMWRSVAKKAADVKKTAADGKISASDIDDQIQTIQQRLKRGNELDFEKVQEAIVKDLHDNYDHSKMLLNGFSQSADTHNELLKLFMHFILFSLVDNYQYTELLKKLGIENMDGDINDDPIDLFDRLLNMDSIALNTIVKCILVDRFHTIRTNKPEAYIIRKLADALDIEVDKHVALQDVAKHKRIANANKKIAELQALKDDLKEKKKLAAAKKEVAPGAKKVASKAKKAA